MLMEEEDLENKPYMLHDCLALQATDKSLHDLLTTNNQITSLDTAAATSSEISSFLDSSWSDNVEPPLISPSQFNCPYLYPHPPPVGRSSREKKHQHREEVDFAGDHRSTKHWANNVGESEPLEMFDKVLLCSNADNPMTPVCDENDAKKKQAQAKGSSRGRPKGGKKPVVVDLRSLLMQCAQAVATYDSRKNKRD